MRVQKIEFYDLSNVKHVETYYFHMNKLAREKMAANDPKVNEIITRLSDENAVKERDTGDIFDDLEYVIRAVVRNSIGLRDGARFVRYADTDPDLAKDFTASEQYFALVGDLLADPNEFVDFMSGAMPDDIWNERRGELQKIIGDQT